MSQFLARDSESKGDLISWWEGDKPESEDQVSCAGDEVVVFIAEDEVVATLGPGRHSLGSPPPGLAPYLEDSSDPLEVAFVSTRMVVLDAEGILEELDNEGVDDAELTVRFGAAVRVTAAEKVLGLLEKLGEDESLEEWLIDELVLHVQNAVAQSNLSLDALTSGTHGEQLANEAKQNASEALSEYGIEVPRVADCAISVDEE